MVNEPRPKKSQDYARMQRSLLPRGTAWSSAPEGVLDALLLAAAEELARVDESAYHITREVNPLLTLGALGDWEAILGLPDSCLPAGSSMQERRAAVLYKLNDVGRSDLAWYLEQAEAMGYQVDAEAHQPFVCGLARCGDALCGRLGPPEVAYWLHFVVHGHKTTYFVCGESSLAVSLGAWTHAAELECVFTRDKMAHILITFEYRED